MSTGTRKPPRPLAGRLAALEEAHLPPLPPSPLAHLGEAELEVLQDRLVAGDEEGARALLAEGKRRMAAGEACPDDRDEVRTVYWELLRSELARGLSNADYDRIRREAARLVLERRRARSAP